jgi:hypothetical protein
MNPEGISVWSVLKLRPARGGFLGFGSVAASDAEKATLAETSGASATPFT